MMVATRALLILVLTAASCGKSELSGGSGDLGMVDLAAPVPATASDYVAAVAQALCDLEIRCGFIGRSERAACLKQNAQFSASYDPDAAVAAGRLHYDGNAAGQCIAAYTDASCDEYVWLAQRYWSGLFASCPGGFIPEVAIGGSCRDSGECVGGYCFASPGCAGTCTAFLATGATCSVEGAHCAPSDTCVAATSKCTPRGDAGATCTGYDCRAGLLCSHGICAKSGGAVGDPCDGGDLASRQCMPGLKCSLTAIKSHGTCELPAQENQPCGDGLTTCADNLVCAGPMAPTMGLCKPVIDLGEPCGSGAGACPLDATCKAGVCRRLIEPGDACGPNPNMLPCFSTFEPAFYCEPGTKQCNAVPTMGEACNPSGGCIGPSTCDPMSMVCTIICQ